MANGMSKIILFRINYVNFIYFFTLKKIYTFFLRSRENLNGSKENSVEPTGGINMIELFFFF